MAHVRDMFLDTCSRVLLIDCGTIIADGRAEQILSDKELLEAHRMELPLSLTRRQQ